MYHFHASFPHVSDPYLSLSGISGITNMSPDTNVNANTTKYEDLSELNS